MRALACGGKRRDAGRRSGRGAHCGGEAQRGVGFAAVGGASGEVDAPPRRAACPARQRRLRGHVHRDLAPAGRLLLLSLALRFKEKHTARHLRNDRARSERRNAEARARSEEWAGRSAQPFCTCSKVKRFALAKTEVPTPQPISDFEVASSVRSRIGSSHIVCWKQHTISLS
eukprot:6211741-Pleurochrysis_carterae.AAC.4